MSTDTNTKAPVKRQARNKREGTVVKIYLVYVPVVFEQVGRPNRRLVTAKLNRACADEVAAQIPNAYVVKANADKKASPIAHEVRKL